MLNLILLVVVVVVLAVIPVMFAARMMGAERKSFWAASIAVVLQFALTALNRVVLSDGIIPFLIALVLASAINAYVLGTSLVKGFLIGLIAMVIALTAYLIFGASFAFLFAPST